MKNSPNTQPKIFIVEDDKFYANLIRHTLMKDGFDDCTMLYSGYELLDKLHLGPDIVFLDYQMEDMNGVETLKQLKSINPNIQVVFLSGQEDLNIAITSLKYGAFDYIEKNKNALKKLSFIVKKILDKNLVITEIERKNNKKKAIMLLAAPVIISIAYLFLSSL